MNKKVLVVGSLNYDMFFLIDHFHRIGETLAAEDITIACGGKGANQAVQCARLGLETYMAGCVGNDAAGVFLYESLAEQHVKIDYLKKADCVSGMSAVHALKDGSVYSTIAAGANHRITMEDIDRLVPLMEDCAVVMLQLEIPVPVVIHASKLAKENGCLVLLNAAPAVEVPEEMISGADVFIVNEVEASFYTNDIIDGVDKASEYILKLVARYGSRVIFTLGKIGAVVGDGSRVLHIPSLDVPVVDTMGAGDSFVGGLAYSLVNGNNIFDAAEFASYCSAATISGLGSQSSMPAIPEIEELRMRMRIDYERRVPRKH
ncbi:MAG: ribokinase [Synergistaceae bacterium]|jgi:ribokinase|nr:ribokinase [Synergistaceae bacterium]